MERPETDRETTQGGKASKDGEAAKRGKDDGRRRMRGLSAKLLGLTILFVMIAEILIFVPSIANFRNGWLRDRLATARVTAVALSHQSAAGNMELTKTLLKTADAWAISVVTAGRRQLYSVEDMPHEVDAHVDMRTMSPLRSMIEAFGTLSASGHRMLRVSGAFDGDKSQIELIIDESGLRDAMFVYSRNILGLSLLISLITATLVYLSLRWLLVRPLQRMTRSMISFSENPQDRSRILQPSGRTDELGAAEARLSDMQSDLNETLQNQRRLANLGLAVSKINHDLRNMLASAQLFTDRLGHLTDPTVQRLAPKLIGTLDRAVSYTRSVLAYGRAQEAPPDRRLIVFRRLVDDVGEMLGLNAQDAIDWRNEVPDDIEMDADPDQMFRVLTNLVRNSVQALEQGGDRSLVRRLAVTARRQGGIVVIEVEDTGPGIPERAREHLFQAFQGSARKGGTGLGLAIAAELVGAHGGRIELVESGPGSRFRITLPDRPVDLQAARAASAKGASERTG